MTRRGRARFAVYCSLFLITWLPLPGCGGGHASPPPPHAEDFAIAAQPATVSVAQGASANVAVVVTGRNGFTSQVSVTITGVPSGVTVTPASFTLLPGTQQTVIVAATISAATTTVNLTVAGAAGSLAHNAQLALAVKPAPDFAVSVQPASISVAPRASALATISVIAAGDFNSQVDLSITGALAGVTITPSTFHLAPGAQQTVTFTASASAPFGAVKLALAGSSGVLAHTNELPLAVAPAQTAAHAPFRTRVLRTDAQHDTSWAEYFPQPLTLYDPGTKRFFLSSTYLNRIDVFDAVTQINIGHIPVPGAFTLDESPDRTTIWAGTQIGDIYALDPVRMTVKRRYAAVEIGPAGYPAYEARVLADGRLALLGDQGGIPAIDGFGSMAIWNPADNSFQKYGNLYDGQTLFPPCGMSAFATFSVTADRTKLILGGNGTAGSVCLFDPATGVGKLLAGPVSFDAILVPSDGNTILLASGDHVVELDATEFYKIGEFAVGEPNAWYRYCLSFDTNTLYAFPRFSGDIAVAYDWRTKTVKGWFPTPVGPAHFLESVLPQAADETGLIAGIMGYGIAFVDSAPIHHGAPLPAQFIAGLVLPPTGPIQGGTQTLIRGTNEQTTAHTAYFGTEAATGISTRLDGTSATTPRGAAGPADVVVLSTAGGMQFTPEGFSYGPWIVEATPDSATAEGGGTGRIYGYGFGPIDAQQAPADLHVSVGGKPATITRYSGYLGSQAADYPVPLQTIEFTIPSGTAGAGADISIASSSGSVTVINGLQYLPAVQTFPLAGAALLQGIYDARRDVYYFTDVNRVQVFSKALGRWLAPIDMPAGAEPSAMALWGIALSPDGSKLAVSDPGATFIYVLDPDAAASGKAFSVRDTDQNSRPGGLAVTDTGLVYYMTFSLYTGGAHAFHRLDTNTGMVNYCSSFQESTYGDAAYSRIAVSHDNRRMFINYAGGAFIFDVDSDAFYWNPMVWGGSSELAISSNQTWMYGGEYLMDTNLNPWAFPVFNRRQTWNVSGVYGSKLSSDGNLLFSPLTDGIDVIDGRLGVLLTRIALPIPISATYDALVANGKDNVLVAITGENSDGVAVIDLNLLSEPLPLPYATAGALPRMSLATGALPPFSAAGKQQATSVNRDATTHQHVRRVVKDVRKLY